MRKKIFNIAIILIIIYAIILLSGCNFRSAKVDEENTWREEAPDIYTYDFYNSLDAYKVCSIQGLLHRPYIEATDDSLYMIINNSLYKNGERQENCIIPDRFPIIVGGTENYLYIISSLGSGYNLYRYSYSEDEIVKIYSNEEEKEEYGFDTISKSIWINDNDCLLVTIENGASNMKRDYSALYIFSDDAVERYEITDETIDINVKYKCQQVEGVQFITNTNHDWYIECDGMNDRENTIVCDGHVFKSGQLEPISGYEILNESSYEISGYTWYIDSYEDKAIYSITGGKYYKGDYQDVINTSTTNWRYDAIDIYDTSSDERYTLYEDGTNRIIGYNPDANEVYLYVYSDNTLISKDLDDDTIVSLESFEDADTISFVWEGTDLYYFYGADDDMSYGGMVDVAIEN